MSRGAPTSLELHSCDIDMDGLRSLSIAPLLGGLNVLALCRIALGEEGAEVLVKARMPRSKTLDLATGQVGAAGMDARATSDLSHNGIGDVGIAALAASPSLRELVSLDVSRDAIGDAGAAALAEAKLPRLRTVKIEGNPLKERR